MFWPHLDQEFHFNFQKCRDWCTLYVLYSSNQNQNNEMILLRLILNQLIFQTLHMCLWICMLNPDQGPIKKRDRKHNCYAWKVCKTTEISCLENLLRIQLISDTKTLLLYYIIDNNVKWRMVFLMHAIDYLSD